MPGDWMRRLPFRMSPPPLKEILVSHAVQYQESQLVTMRLRESLSHLPQKLANTEGALDALHQKHRQQEQGQQRRTSTSRTRSTQDCTYTHVCTHAHDHAHGHARERAHTRGHSAQERNTATRAARSMKHLWSAYCLDMHRPNNPREEAQDRHLPAQGHAFYTQVAKWSTAVHNTGGLAGTDLSHGMKSLITEVLGAQCTIGGTPTLAPGHRAVPYLHVDQELVRLPVGPRAVSWTLVSWSLAREAVSLELSTSAIGLPGVAPHSVLADRVLAGRAGSNAAPLGLGCITPPVARSPTLQPPRAIVRRNVSPGAGAPLRAIAGAGGGAGARLFKGVIVLV